jgi:hypothetical protein
MERFCMEWGAGEVNRVVAVLIDLSIEQSPSHIGTMDPVSWIRSEIKSKLFNEAWARASGLWATEGGQ